MVYCTYFLKLLQSYLEDDIKECHIPPNLINVSLIDSM